ncbi:MAG: pilus assembly FimT family protein [Myxococcales bacterium]
MRRRAGFDGCFRGPVRGSAFGLRSSGGLAPHLICWGDAPAPRASAGGPVLGFTLLEITISLVLLVMALSVAIPSLESLTGVRMRSAAGKLAGALRALYDESALSGRTCRMAFDLDARTYWPECAPNGARLSSVKEESRDGKRYIDELAQREEQERVAELQRDNPIEARIEAKTPFARYEDEAVKRFQLPDGVSFGWVWTPHQTQKYSAGDAYLYFFPQGNAERGLITLTHGDDAISLAVSPLTGKVKLTQGEAEVPKS